MHCDHHPTCPGCPLLERSYDDQLLAKQERLAQALAQFPHLPAAPPVRPALHTEAYRHRLKLPLHHGKERVSLGLVDPRTGRVVHTPDCPVLVPALRQALPPLLQWLHGKRSVHSVDLRASAAHQELQLVLACRGGKLPGGKGGARELLRQVPGLVSVAVSEADPHGKRVMGRRPRMVAGHALLREAIGAADRIVDAYCGVGALGLAVAAGIGTETVIGCDVVPSAIAAATDAAGALGIRAAYHQGRPEDLDPPGEDDVVLLDPPRKGCSASALRVLGTARRLVYVSCGTSSFIRDARRLMDAGYRPVEILPAEMLPYTPHVEWIARFERA